MISKKPSGPGDFVTQAYAIKNDKARLAFYKTWAEDYDQQMQTNLGYSSPETIAQALARHSADHKAAVLDVGCGTGLTAYYLAEMGFTTIDGLDYSVDMIQVARSKNIYRQLLIADLNQPLDIADDSYTAIISSGTFTHGHVGPEPLDELLRTIKPQGLMAFTVHEDLWQTKGFANKCRALESEHLITQVQLTHAPFYADREPEGWFCIYRKS